MHPIRSRILCLALVLVLATCTVLQGATPVHAAYENTHTNTGDYRTDLIQVALTQVGYTEGYRNYTKYGVWYGSSNMAWCGAFVSWCANQANIPTSIIKKNGFASASSFGLTDTFYYSSGRTPRPGDLFFKSGNTHVGIVYYVEGSYFYTIEGNTNAQGGSEGTCVRIQKRSLSGSYYFASPKYPTDGGHNYKQAYESAHPHREYMYCEDCSDYYYTGRTGSSSTCSTCIQQNCSHNYGSWKKISDSQHQRTCVKCEKTDIRSHNWNSGTVTKKATCKETGEKKQTCTTCEATRTVTLSKLDTHTYGAWEYKDEENHYRKCTVCDKEESKNHSRGGDWETDLFYHWYTCEVCDGKAGLEEHIFGDGCEEPCDKCDYLRSTGHIYEKAWTYDEKGHWHKCENCDQPGSFTSHVFDAECDETCATCDFVRVTQHSYTAASSSDESGHYHVCAACGSNSAAQPHTPGDPATEQSAQLCTDCGYVVTPQLEHIHDFSPMTSDEHSHWGQCRCGEPYPRESHLWDVGTGLCSICEASLPAEPEPQTLTLSWWMYLIPVIALLAAACVVLIIVILVRRKRRVPVAV